MEHQNLIKDCLSTPMGNRALDFFKKGRFSNSDEPLEIDDFVEQLLKYLLWEHLLKNGTGSDFRNNLYFETEQLRTGNINVIINHIGKFGSPLIRWRSFGEALSEHSKEGQKKFLKDFFQRISTFKSSFKGSVSLILGNDDFAGLKSDLDEADSHGLIINNTNKVVQLSPDVQVHGVRERGISFPTTDVEIENVRNTGKGYAKRSSKQKLKGFSKK